MKPDRPSNRRPAEWLAKGPTDKLPVAAATVILVRDAPGGVETLMLRRNSKIACGGRGGFPGGRSDEADRAGLDPADELAIGGA